MRYFALLLSLTLQAQTIDQLERGFRTPSEDAKIMMRWWWFGPSATKADIDTDLRKMKEGGIGGVEIQPVYPLALEGNYPYLSNNFLEALRYARTRAAELGLRVDLTLGSGWPFGGPHIPVTQASGRLRIERITIAKNSKHFPAPALADGETLIAYFEGNKLLLDLDELLKEEDEARTVTAFISSRTGMQVKRPSINAEGFVLDHYDRSALDNHLKNVGEKLLAAFPANPPRAIFSDSLEVFASDWTPDFLAQFRKRRGYDLTPKLPALAGDIGPETGAIRNDWGRTLTELCNERYLAPLADWAHKHRTLLRSQTYGVPPVSLASQSIVDLPEGEKPHWRAFTPARWASSAAHLYNKQAASSETWTWLHSPAFRATPLDMKVEADLHFLQGITQLVGHGWPMSPPSAGEPGNRFYAAAVFNHHNPWWIVMPDIAGYLQRVSWLLRQGRPANDVALYLPTADARARFTAGNVSIDRQFEGGFGVAAVIPQILDAGYNFDFTDDETIEKLGITHPVLVLPSVERMSAAASRKIAEYKANGGIVIAYRRLPDKAPGLKDAAPQKLDVSVTGDLPQALHHALAPDVRADPGIGFVHRKTPDADIYFIANTTNRALPADIELRAKGKRETWDPFTGSPAAGWRSQLAPYESRVIVVANRRESPLDTPHRGEAVNVNFSGNPWGEFFSGVQRYEAQIARPAGSRFILDFGSGSPVSGSQGNRPGMRAWLESPVREAAIVYVNGKKAGSIWKPPYELDVTTLLQPGANTVRLEVANTAINRLAGASLPNYKLLNSRYGERFQPQDMNNLTPLPSGLMGPVRLVAIP